MRVYQGNLHAKGYVFDKDEMSTVIVGSSNLTQMALTCNKEWNVLFRSYDRGGMLWSIRSEFAELWESSETVALPSAWIDEYADYWKSDVSRAPRKATFVQKDDTASVGAAFDIRPNKMQQLALAALKKLHARQEPRALLVSATGTGKTYLSAFDVAATKPSRILFLVHRRRILDASLASYSKLLGDEYSYGVYVPGSNTPRATCLFGMASDGGTILMILLGMSLTTSLSTRPSWARQAKRIMEYFTPKFYLGMTATPSRTDGFDVFELFNHVIAFQITLQDALANDMLAPFHYFGIADLEIGDESVDDAGLFSRLTSDERVRHIIEKIEEYTVDKEHRCGLMFCGRNDEAAELSRKLK